MGQIKKISRKDLQIEKYSRTLHDAINYRIYAEYWYLDILTHNQWECWIYNDYEVIMPVPLQYKLGIKFVLQPFYCQQLGVFYKQEISQVLFKVFEKKLHRHLVRAYQFNEENTKKYLPQGTRKVNHVLDLNSNFEKIYDNFKKDRKKDLRRGERQGLILKENRVSIDQFMGLFVQYYPELAKEIDLKLMRSIIEGIEAQRQLKLVSVCDADGRPYASCLLLKSRERLILLFSVRDKSQEIKGSFAYLLAKIMEEHSDRPLLFDFEGSSLSGIAVFNESFGAEIHPYIRYSNITF